MSLMPSSDMRIAPSDASPEVSVETYRRELEYALGIPFVDGNRTTPLQNGDEIFPSMLEAIEQASFRIDFLTFIYWTGEIARQFGNALSDAARRGLRVKVLLDSYGAQRISHELLEKMQAAGVVVRWFRPLSTWRIWRSDKRTHRKILVCDDAIGFTGGVGIADEWSGNARNPTEWRETHLRIEGPAVSGLRAAFMDNWNEAGDWEWQEPPDRVPPDDVGDDAVQIVRASSTVGWTDMAGLLRAMLHVARRRARLVTAYFVPDPPLISQLIEARRRGVDVEILVPGKYCDSRLSQLAGYSAVEELLGEGVRFWSFSKTMLHAKVLIVDDIVCCVGSVNLNRRSVGKDEECSAVILSENLAGSLNRAFEADQQSAEEILNDEWRQRSRWTRIKEKFAQLLIEQL